MAYLPKSMVEKNIKTRTRKDRRGNEHTDYEAYVGIDPFTSKPVRITRADMKDLLKALADWYARHRAGGDAAVRLSAVQAMDAKSAYDALASAGVSVSLFDAVTAYINGKGREAEVSGITVGKAWEQYLAGKRLTSDERNVRASVGRWALTCGDRTLSSVTAKDVLDYLQDNYKDRKPKTYNQNLLYLKTFLNWCAKEERAWIAKNPIKSLDYRPEPWEEPEYMKPKDVEALFRLLEANKESYPEYLAYMVVSFFCGCRSVEIRRMASDPDAAKINLEEETVRLAKGKGYQQGKRPRAFHVHPTALAWMKSFDFLSALSKVTDKTQSEIYELARANAVPVFCNCGRHTFITYHVAAYGEPEKTQAMVGTSEKMRAENYCGLATKADGEAFFRILPVA